MTSTVYLVAEIEAIADATALKEYGAKVSETLTPFNDHYRIMARGGKIHRLDGGLAPERVAIIEFESPEQAHAWYGLEGLDQ